MRRERGFTLYELLVTMTVIGAASMSCLSAANGIHREDAASRAYCADVRGMRHVVRQLRTDLRNAATVEDLDWRREGDRLFRGQREIARNVRAFEVTEDGAWASVRVVVGGRRELSVGDGAELGMRVRMRNAGRAR